MRRFLSPALLAAALLLSSCSPQDLLWAELEVPALGVTIPSYQFPASTAAAGSYCAGQPDCIQQDLVYDLGQQVDLLTDPHAHYEIRLKELALVLVSNTPGEDMRGVTNLSIEAVPLDGGTPVAVASYTKAPGATPTRIAVAANEGVDLAPYLKDGKITVRVKMGIEAATPAFTADVSGTFFLKVRLDYGKMI